MYGSVKLGEKGSMSDSANRCSSDVVIPSDPGEAHCIQQQIEQALKELQYGEHDIFSIRLAVEEALINAIKHGNQMDRSKKIRISYKIDAEKFDVQIEDEGRGFDPAQVPDPTIAENLERPCGRGLMLMRYYMNRVDYNAPGNLVSMTKYCNGMPKGT